MTSTEQAKPLRDITEIPKAYAEEYDSAVGFTSGIHSARARMYALRHFTMDLDEYGEPHILAVFEEVPA